MKAEKKKLDFGGGLTIYITVLVTVLLAGLGFMLHYLMCYENDRIESVMDKYMTQQLPDSIQQQIDLYSISCQTGYQSAGEIAEILVEQLSGDQWTYRENHITSTDEKRIFTIYSEQTAVGEAVVYPGETTPARLGFGTWQAPEVTFDLEQFGRTVKIIVPYGCDVYINGELTSDDKVAETIGLYPQLQKFEKLISDPNQLMVYQIEGTFVEIAVGFSEGYTMLKSDEEDVFYAVPVCDDALAEELIEQCKDFVKAYVEYTANKNGLWAVQQYIVPDCALYQELTELSTGMKWGHGIHAKINTLDIRNFTYYGNVITCEASYSMTTDDGDSSENMQIMLVNTILGWRVIFREIT